MRAQPLTPASGSTSRLVILGLFLALAAAAFWPALHGGLLWDDDQYITKPELRSWSGLVRIWTELGATPQYYPLTYSAFWVQHKLWGDQWSAYHLVNVLLHAVNAFLLWRILVRLAVPGALLAACIFAVHPVQVESVAWITELKNTLSGAAYLGAFLVYLRFHPMDGSARPAGDARRAYLTALALFTGAVLAKSVTASLPAVVLLIAWWKRGSLSWKRDVVPLVPFFLVAAVLGAVTVWMEFHVVGAKGAKYELAWIERVLLAGRVVWFYLGKLLWPADLAFIYPRWNVDQALAWQYAFPAAALIVLAALWIARRRIGRAPVASAFYFVGTLFPVLGFVNVFPFVYSYVADHFQYLACIGPITAASAWLAHALARLPHSIARGTAPAVLVGALCALSQRQSFLYRDVEVLWRKTIETNPECWMAYSNLGVLHAADGDVDAAIGCYEKALAIRADLVDVHYNLGNALVRKGLTDDGIRAYERAIELAPEHFRAHNNLGHVLFSADRTAEAIAHFERAVDLEPAYAQAHFNLGRAYVRAGRIEPAIEQYRRAIDAFPEYADAYNNLGTALARHGDLAGAIAAFERALTIQPGFAEAYNNLGQALLDGGDARGAIRALESALKARPDYPAARANLERARSAAPGTRRQ